MMTNIASMMQRLYQQFGDIPGISIECQKELIAIGIKNKAATAEIFLQGAQISHYQQAHKQQLLFLSEACDFKKNSALRGGIPICWPWFGDLAKNHHDIQQQLPHTAQPPAHGFVRNHDWEVKSITTPSDKLTIIELTLPALESPNNKHPFWPFATQLSYKIKVGNKLSAHLTVKNLSQKPFVFSAALHTYFAISDINILSISGFDQSTYTDALDNWQIKTQEGDIVFKQEVDRIYHTTCTKHDVKTITLNDGDRKINICSQGSNSTVAWNPWIEKSQRLSQFKPDDYYRMVCIETANALEDRVTLKPGKTHCLGVTLNEE